MSKATSTGADKGTEKFFKKHLTVLEQHELLLQIQKFMQKRIPTLIKYKMSLLMDDLLKKVKPYTELNNQLVEEFADETGQLQQFLEGKPNPKFKLYRNKIEPVEKEKSEVVFKQYPLSYILRKDDAEDIGGFPMVYKLFYEDDLSIRLFEKWMKEKEDSIQAELELGKDEKGKK